MFLEAGKFYKITNSDDVMGVYIATKFNDINNNPMVVAQDTRGRSRVLHDILTKEEFDGLGFAESSEEEFFKIHHYLNALDEKKIPEGLKKVLMEKFGVDEEELENVDVEVIKMTKEEVNKVLGKKKTKHNVIDIVSKLKN